MTSPTIYLRFDVVRMPHPHMPRRKIHPKIFDGVFAKDGEVPFTARLILKFSNTFSLLVITVFDCHSKGKFTVSNENM